MIKTLAKNQAYAQTFNILLTDKKNISIYPLCPSIDSCLGYQVEEEEISLLHSYTA
jgi:hypothetical protein